MNDKEAPLSKSKLNRYQKSFDKTPEYKLRLNALTKTQLVDLILNREVVTSTGHVFSHTLDDWAVTNQKASGRCWCFAGLNLLRVGAMKKMKIKQFEFSQNWTLFWDKIERSNYFFEQIIDTSRSKIDDRTVQHLLGSPIGDGGQWHMFVDIVHKYGLVPKSAMPETSSSSSTAQLNQSLNYILRQGARDIRSNSKNKSQMRQLKHKLMEGVYRVLCMHLGVPPKQFDWKWRDTDKVYHCKRGMTPQQFAKEYVTVDLNDYACVVHDPRPKQKYSQTYTVDRLGNVVDGTQVIYLNAPIEVMKTATLKSLLDGEPVWMGCDVGKHFNRELGIWDETLYEQSDFYNIPFTLSKADRLELQHAAMTHAMLFTGVDLLEADGSPKPQSWRVENSWGKEGGSKGFYVMNDNWFDEHMYEIAVQKKYLPSKYVNALEKKPIVLPPWDPMGALAG